MFLLFLLKFLGWIITSWVRQARLIGEEGSSTTKMKYILSKKKIIIGPGGPAPPGFSRTKPTKKKKKKKIFAYALGFLEQKNLKYSKFSRIKKP